MQLEKANSHQRRPSTKYIKFMKKKKKEERKVEKKEGREGGREKMIF